MPIYLIIGVVVGILAIIGVVVFVVLKGSNNKYEIIEENESEVVMEEITPIVEKKGMKKKKSKEKKSKVDKNQDNNNKPRTPGMIYYDEYDMALSEKVMWSIVGIGIVFVAGYIFYQSFIWAGVISIVGIVFPKIMKKNIIKTRKQKLLVQFKEALYALSSSISAGQSVPMAFKAAYNDLEFIYGDNKDCYILQELLYINRRIDRNETIEEALSDFAERSGLEDVQTFADIFEACNRSGGNLRQVIHTTSNVIGDKITINQEIDTMISGKKFESKILTAIPFGIVLFLKFSSPDFISSLYTAPGRIVSTVALIMIAIASLWGQKITNIEV